VRLSQFLAVGLSAWLLVASQAQHADPLLTYPLKIGGHSLRAEIANTEDTRLRGLMFRKSLPENRGMVFVYPEEGHQAMWMKNTLIPLSVAFIDRDGKIQNIADMEPHSERSHASAGNAKYALEVNRGWFAKRGIRSGDRVEGLKKLPPPR
jgi:uncharacterized membrane protein (UPF0127 family)